MAEESGSSGLDVDVLVVGAGIVGSWVALRAQQKHLSVALCDASERPGDGISGRNSGVLHAGLYYDADSLKAKHCARGKSLAEEFISKHNLPILRCGKIIPTTIELTERLMALQERAKVNGATVEILTLPDPRFIDVKGSVALWSPLTGVVDATAYLKCLHHAFEECGGSMLPGRRFLEFTGNGSVLCDRAGRTETVRSRFIVNCCGLYSDDIARSVGLASYEIRPVRGEYFRLSHAHPAGVLVYPLPGHEAGTALGVHYTVHPSGEAYAGPNAVPAESKQDYRITASHAAFFRSLNEILDGYSEQDLQPGYAGLRPRLFRGGSPLSDFVIEEYPANFFHFLGIESPGLTAAPSLVEELPFLN